IDLPLIGDQLKDLANLIDPQGSGEKGLLDVKSAITAALGGSNPLEGLADADAVVTAINNLASDLDTALGGGVTVTGDVECKGGDCSGKSIADVEGVSFDVSLGESISETAGDFDIGIPGLGLTSDQGGVGIAGGWSLDLGFGISRADGFYIKTGTPADGPELDINATVTLPPTIDGLLGFLEIKIFDGHPTDVCSAGKKEGCTPTGVTQEAASTFGPQFFIDLKDPDADGRLTFGEMSQGPSFGELFEYDLTATADVNLHIETQIKGGGDLPRLFTDLFIDWSWALSDQLDPDGVGLVAPTIKLDNVYLDAGTFLGEFLGPIVRDVQKYTKPLDPIIDQLTTPIPVLSDFAGEPVTLLTLAEVFGPADNKYDLIFDLIKLVDFVNGINANSDLLLINIGEALGGLGFDLDAAKLRQGSLPASDARSVFDQSQLASIDSAGSLLTKIDGKTGDASKSGIKSAGGLSEIGLTFPFLDEPSQLMGLLFGQDVDLVVFRPKPLEFGFSYSQKFGPIWAVPPVFVEIGGSASITGRFGVGYDTQGLREVLFEGAGGGALLNGLFLVDVDANGVDVNELEFEGRLFANAQVSVLIFSAGAEGSIFTTIGIDIVDPNSDGKLKFAEARDILVATGNPLCLFSLNGNFGVAIDVFAEVDLFFWSKKWTKTLAEIILYKFEVECDFNKEPTLASSGNYDLDQHLNGLGDGTSALETVLMLNLGARRAERGAGTIGINTAEEEFVVKKELDNSLTVSAFGIDTNYPGPWDGVFLDMADGAPGDPEDRRDVITFADNVVGGENETVAGSTEYNRCGNATDDDNDGAVNDGCPVADEFDAPESGTDCDNATDDDGDGRINEGCPKVEVAIPFDLSVVALNGSDGPDQITGGHGGHYIETGAGNDQVTTKEGNDKVVAGTGNDQVGTGDGDDVIIGGPNDAGGAEDDDTLDGGPGADGIDGGAGSDVINGGLTIPAQPEQNILEQPDGIDTINGGPGDDEIDGGPGNDVLNGDGGSDRISGDIGNDTINGGNETSTCDANGNGRSLGDVLVGGPGSDTIHGNGGDDVIIGGNLTAGDDDTGDTLLDGDGGCDLILGDNGEFTDPENPYSFVIPTDGVGGNDAIEGGSGADELHGQVG
ncbi:MAG: calcium-binding protein, partial [Planctomycetota bacterium]